MTTVRDEFKAWRTQNGVAGLWLMCSMIGGAITIYPAAFILPKNAALWVVPIMAASAIIMTIVVFVLSFIISIRTIRI